MSKIDTQGMSGEATEGCSDNIYPHDENGEPILPRAVIRPNSCLLYTSPSPRD